MADLLTLDEYKDRVGIDSTDTRKDTEIEALIPGVTSIFRSFTGRDFGTDTVIEARPFEYDGSGFLDIDDATEITEVRFTVPHSTDIVLDSDTWYAAPPRRDDSPVYYYIVLTSFGGGINPWMGFERNLDVLFEEGRLPSVTRTSVVTGTWGWPDIPEDVKIAAVWTIQDWISKPSGGENLTAEAIEGYSRAWGSKTGAAVALAVPNRARDILANYQKLYA